MLIRDPKLSAGSRKLLHPRKEEESIEFYKALAKTLNWGGLRETFLLLAQEEARHKLRFEEQYKDKLLKGI